MSLNKIDKAILPLRVQIGIIAFFGLFVSTSLMVIGTFVIVSNRIVDSSILQQAQSLNIANESLSSFIKDVITHNFWNAIFWILFFNMIIDILLAYIFATWVAVPIETLHISLSNAYKNGIPYVSITNEKFTEVEEISNLVSDMTNNYLTALESQNKFLQDISHELKTPLAAMKSTADVLKMNPNPTLSDYKLFFSTNQQLQERMINLVNKLTLSNKSDIELYDHEPVNVSKILKEVLTSLHDFASEKGIKLTSSIEDKVRCKGSSKYLSVAFTNIVENAIKYSSKKNSEIKVSLKRNKKDGVVISIKDNGIGISEADLKHVFGRFYRGDNVQNIDGTGLGLSIAYRIISAHGGKINIYSKLGHGTQVKILL